MRAFLTDPAHIAAFAAGLTTLLVQGAASKGFVIDAHTADAFTACVVGLALAVIGKHTSTANAETKADAQVDSAKIEAGHQVPQAGTPPSAMSKP